MINAGLHRLNDYFEIDLVDFLTINWFGRGSV